MKEEKKTQVIYLNEDDRPKVEEKLTFYQWWCLKYGGNDPTINNKTGDWNVGVLNRGVNEYHDYLNNLSKQKPIEFIGKPNLKPSDCKLIVVQSPTTFSVFKDNEVELCVRGKLNSGTV